MELTEFELERATFEVRYEPAFQLWDGSGALTGELLKKIPDTEVVDGQPAKISYRIGRIGDMCVELDKSFVVLHYPQRSLETLTPIAEQLVKLLLRHLKVSQFNRVGTRVLYTKKYEDLQYATKKLLDHGPLGVPEGKHFGQEGSPKQADFSLRWEGPALGTWVRIFTETVKVEFTPPPAIREVSPTKSETSRLAVDIDYYSTAAMLPEQLHVADWIKNVVHVANRDIKNVLKG